MALIKRSKSDKDVSDINTSCSGIENSHSTIILTVILVMGIVAIIFCAKFILAYNITKYKTTYNSDEEMLQDISGTWQLYDFKTKRLLDSYLIFDDTYSETFVSYDDHNEIDMRQNNKIKLHPKDATITIIHSDGTLSNTAIYDVVEYENTKYIRMRTKEAKPNNWTPFKKVSQSTKLIDI